MRFIVCQGSLLVLDALDGRLLQQLGIEAHQLLADGGDGTVTHEVLDPGDLLDTTGKRRREPA
ncbi:hypothetical protein KSC_040220 [Ktedonobacter sp. SOSP1-52]|nr:hypothetical protein KSC_040220 [Ktedonobacter sp. SOSP1-52]